MVNMTELPLFDQCSGFYTNISIYVALAFFSFFISIVILFKYTSLPKVYNSVITNKKPIRNEFWVIYYFLVSVFSLVRIAGFLIPTFSFEIVSIMLQAMLSYVLICALQWQRRYRSQSNITVFENKRETYGDIYNADESREPMIDSEMNQGSKDSESQMFHHEKPNSSFKNIIVFIFSGEIIGFALLVINLITCLFWLQFQESIIVEYIQLTTIAFQKILLFIVVLIIIFMPRSRNHSSPTLWVRVIALLALILSSFHDIPLYHWFQWIKCGKWDLIPTFSLISLAFFLSLIFWIIFIVAEFHRSREQAMFHAFQATQSSLEFVADEDSDS